MCFNPSVVLFFTLLLIITLRSCIYIFLICQTKFCLLCHICPRADPIGHNVWLSAVAGIGGLSNAAKRNAKADQLRLVLRHNVNKETDSCEDT